MVVTRYVLKNRVLLYYPAAFFFPKNHFCYFYTDARISLIRNRFLNPTISPPLVLHRFTSNNTSSESKRPTSVQKLKTAIKDYGSTVIVFHVTISLISLGSFYLAVCSGLDVIELLQKLGVNMSERMSAVVEGAGTFAIAYAVHKIFAPVRISITLATTPFIVRYLRKIGLLKPLCIKTSDFLLHQILHLKLSEFQLEL